MNTTCEQIERRTQDAYTVVFNCNNAVVAPLSIAIWSLVKKAAPNTVYDVRILSDGISPENRERLKEMVKDISARHSLSFIEIDSIYREAESRGYDLSFMEEGWPRVSWARIFTPDILPEVKRVLYLDVDVLVCADCSELFTLDMRGAAVGGVYEHASTPEAFYVLDYDMPSAYPGYLNAGVLLLDLEVFRRENLTRKILETGALHYELFGKSVAEGGAVRQRHAPAMPDQDALNAALYDRVFRLHPRWNWNDITTRRFLSYSDDRLCRGCEAREVVEASLYPAIVHFAGRYKPWKPNYHIMRGLYEQAVAESGLPGFDMKRGWGLKMRLRCWLYRPLYALTWRKIRRKAREFGITGPPGAATWGLSSDLAVHGWPPERR